MPTLVEAIGGKCKVEDASERTASGQNVLNFCLSLLLHSVFLMITLMAPSNSKLITSVFLAYLTFR